ncbi:NAD(P)-binding protein [Lophiostoma macrostomum CBS 122681]|uniref:NAD(P)-binding protein n=1 Tax=Lophiostoma macrostomum CBS 122681 TaxID=1314788 RepID=A0A6A6SSU9_9PLEO|nr:NAD(P)-binding protein [Lophiostoma macrostomum CBS 122681]
MALPIIAVVGATGAQGAGVVSAFTAPGKSGNYHIRALTSNTTTPAAEKLKALSDVSVKSVDLNSIESVLDAFRDASYIFANTIFHPETFMSQGPKAAQEREEGQGLNIVRAAAQTPSLKHLVWSGLPDAYKISKGAFDIPHFQSKIPAEQFIWSKESGLSERSTVLHVGLYGSNPQRPLWQGVHVPVAKKLLITVPFPPEGELHFIGDETINPGLFTRSIIEQPEKTIGRVVLGSAELISCQRWIEILTEVFKERGQDFEAGYLECTYSSFVTFWGPSGKEIGDMLQYWAKMDPADSWQDYRGFPVLTAADLGVEKELRSTKDRLLGMNEEEFDLISRASSIK